MWHGVAWRGGDCLVKMDCRAWLTSPLLQIIPNITVPMYVLKGCVALISGILSGLLTPGAVRMSRCLALALDPPPATQQYLSFGALSTSLMQLAVALPAIGAVFWVMPCHLIIL